MESNIHKYSLKMTFFFFNKTNKYFLKQIIFPLLLLLYTIFEEHYLALMLILVSKLEENLS